MIGKSRWAISLGYIPLAGSGPEPAFTSRDQISLLNTTSRDLHTRWTIYYASTDPIEGYEIAVPARRVRKVRVNDLIFPEAIPLEIPYGIVVDSDGPIVVQLLRLDSGHSAHAILGANGFAGS